MSVSGAEPVRWSWRRWAWIGLGGVAIHLALVAWFGQRTRPAPRLRAPEPLFQIAADGAAGDTWTRSWELSDPTLFALPAPNGFSGGAWLSFRSAPLPTNDWTEPPAWLPLETNGLGRAFQQLAAANRRNGSMQEDLLKLRTTRADILLVGDLVATQSVVRVEGDLTNRPLLTPLPVPNPAYADVLSDTVVLVKVDADGLVESGLVLAGSGLSSLDNQALALARAARFQPQPRSTGANAPTWGRLVFQWCPIPTEATNTLTLKRE